MALEQAERRAKVAELRRQGLSFREIGHQLEISHETARKDAARVLTVVDTLPAQPRSRGQAFREHVLDVFELDRPEKELLEQACRLLDHADALQVSVEADGAVVITAHGDRRVHPAIAEQRAVSLAIGRLLGQLQLPGEDGGEVLPTPAQAQARKAARTRWANHNRRPGRGSA
jgi:hypothetical protein